MKKLAVFFAFFIYFPLLSKCFAQDVKPDTVKVGVYITSIHDIDFKQKEYALNLWLW
jgi:hypothetical protein